MIRALTITALLCWSFTAAAAEVVVVPPWELHDSFWMCLHQRLIKDAMRSDPNTTTELSPEARTAWDRAVDAYRAAGGHGNMTFSKPMVITSDALTQVADDAVDPLIDAPLAEALLLAAPVYREHWWGRDDRANRFFIAYAAAMLREAGEPLVRQHESVYRCGWPERVRVYVTPSAGPFGAYTFQGLAGGVITTMSCRDEGYQGFRALEMLLHESSHAVVGPNEGAVTEAIRAAAESHGVPIPRDLWHAIIFATSSELTRRWLAERGVDDFVPSSDDLFTRVWPRYREPVDRFWIAYLNGEGTLEKAIDGIVLAIRE